MKILHKLSFPWPVTELISYSFEQYTIALVFVLQFKYYTVSCRSNSDRCIFVQLRAIF